MYTPVFTAALFAIAEIQKQQMGSTIDEWLKWIDDYF